LGGDHLTQARRAKGIGPHKAATLARTSLQWQTQDCAMSKHNMLQY
jgi:hypothetical protein